MAEKEVRKTTTKRVVRRTTSKTVPARTTARQAGVTSVRKAPTRITPPTTRTRKSSKGLIVGVLIFILLLAASAGIGFSDKGQLNVENMIALRKQNATGEEKASLETVPVQQSNSNVPNGGLVGMDQSELPPPPVVVETGTSTEASSTPQTEGENTTNPEEATSDADAASETQTQTDGAVPVTETSIEAVAQ